MKQTQNDVETEPPIQPINGEQVLGIIEGGPDIRAWGICSNGQNVYYEIRITNTNTDSLKHFHSKKILEIAKKRKEKKLQ